MKTRIATLLSLLLVYLGGMSAQVEAVTLLSAPTATRSSSEFNASFSEERLFDGPISEADIFTTNNVATDYAGSGSGPHTVYMELTGSELTDGFVYAQRLGGNPAVDKVNQIEFWFENASSLSLVDNSGFGPPARAPDEIIAITNLTPQFLEQYSFSSIYDAQFVFVRLAQGAGNPGGAEFRFTNDVQAVPEPATASLAMIGLAGLVLRRRRSLV